MCRIYFIIIYIIISIPYTWAQNTDVKGNDSGKSIIYEKLYLHIDRHLYSPGDYIWFKAYLVRGLTHKPMPGYKNIYVQMISENGKVVNDRVVLAEDGVAFGDILIADSIPDGYYIIRAFTRYLENFDEESYFHKRIFVSKANNSLSAKNVTDFELTNIDISFLPESGNLVLNAINRIAFKSIGPNGKGIHVSGSILDEKDSLVCRFSTLYNGMGSLMFMPVSGKSYRAILDEIPDFSYTFENIQENGVNLHISSHDNDIAVTLNRNFLLTDTFPCNLVGIHKGVILLHEQINLDGFSKTYRLENEIFPVGITKLMLLDTAFQPLAERLIFIQDTLRNGICINLNKSEFKTREKVEIGFELPLSEYDSLMSSFSVAIVNRFYLSGNEPGQTLVSYLQLDSELKGCIDSPVALFYDSNGVTSAEKLDLLMLVNGWRSYYWDDLIEKDTREFLGWDDAGITLEGYVRGLLRNRPIVNGEVIIGPFSGGLLYEVTRTDLNGRFRFDRLYLRNQEKIFIHAKNQNDKANTEIILDPLRTFEAKPLIFNDCIRFSEMAIPGNFFKENNFRYLQIINYYPEMRNIMLGDIKVVGKNKLHEDGHFRIYPEADRVLTVAEDDYTYANVLDYLSTRGSGVIVSGDQISIRGGGMPLILVDGVRASDDVMVEDALKRMSLSEIDKIEILNDAAKLAAFGSSGGNGVIAIYTRRGDGRYDINKFVKGRVGIQVKGFRKPAQFYSPKYTTENINHPAPDFRPTLLWNPNLEFEKGKSSVAFYTSDELADYLIIMEGISRSGKVFSVLGEFSVTGYHNR